MALIPGDAIRTWAQSHAEVTFPGGTIRVFENVEFEMPRLMPHGESVVEQLTLEAGDFLFRIHKQRLRSEKLQVEPPHLVVGVRG